MDLSWAFFSQFVIVTISGIRPLESYLLERIHFYVQVHMYAASHIKFIFQSVIEREHGRDSWKINPLLNRPVRVLNLQANSEQNWKILKRKVLKGDFNTLALEWIDEAVKTRVFQD